MKNGRSVAENESIFDSIDESSTDDDSDDKSISTNDLEYIQDGNYVHPDIDAICSRLKIYDCIKQA